MTILSGGVSTTNSVESFNRTWNMLVGSNPNTWKVCELFQKQESEESRRILLSNSVGQDLTSNSGRKKRSASSRQRVKLIVEQFNTLPNLEYLQQIAHELKNKNYVNNYSNL